MFRLNCNVEGSDQIFRLVPVLAEGSYMTKNQFLLMSLLVATALLSVEILDSKT